MDAPDFKKTYDELNREKMALLNVLTTLETDLVEIRNKISHLDEVLSHLAPLAGFEYPYRNDGIAKLGITDAIRTILRGSKEKKSAREISDQLQEKGYDLSGLTAPMASIYKILARLADGPDEVERVKEEDGRVFYRWTGITDDDIPF